MFCSQLPSNNETAIGAYRDALRPLAAAAGISLGAARFDDDHYDSKLALLARRPPDVVSFTFGCPSDATIERLQHASVRVWVTVTDVEEATIAVGRAGADALVAQGAQAGGHRGSFVDDDDEPSPLLDLLAAVRSALPTVAGRRHRWSDDRWRHR